MAKFTHEDAVQENNYTNPIITGTDFDDEIDNTQITDYFDIKAGAGDDIINTASGGYVYGQDGDDVITTYPSNITTDLYPHPTWIEGGKGADEITITSSGFYQIWGGDDNDTIHGNLSGENIKGEAGNDTLNGHDGDDTLSGGTGDDDINGGIGDDQIYGDEGIDTAFFNIASSEVTSYNHKNGVITIKSSEGTDTIQSVERFTFKDKTILLEDMDDVFSNVRGAEFSVGHGSYNVTGYKGDDTFNVYTIFDEHAIINAEAGNDLIYYYRGGTSEVDGGDGVDTIAYDGDDAFVDAYL